MPNAIYIDGQLMSIADLDITPISQDDYDALTPAEQLAGVFDIYNAPEPDIDGNKVLYSSSPKKTVNEKIDDIADGESVTITPAQNATVTLNNVKKSGKLIAGACGINYSFTANSWIVVATTTEKPPANVFYSALNPATGGTIGMVQITTTGNIQAYLTTSASGILFSPIYWIS